MSPYIKNRGWFALVWLPLLLMIKYLEETRVVMFEVAIACLLLIWILLLMSRLSLIGFKKHGIIFFGFINLVPLFLYFIGVAMGYEGAGISVRGMGVGGVIILLLAMLVLVVNLYISLVALFRAAPPSSHNKL